jgi:hypothetical protein
MKSITTLTALATILLLASACTSTNKHATEISRFHLDNPIPAQPVNIKASGNGSIEFQNYSAIVATELAKNGYTPSEADADVFVVVDITRGMAVKPPKRSPFSVGIGGGSFGGNVGVGGSANFPVGGGANEVYATKLEVKFIRRAENTIMWEGRAARETEAAPENPTELMQKMVTALFLDFPGDSGKTVVVKDPPTD